MGCTAENLVDQHNISREDQDAFAVNSHQKALAAQASGAFDEEIFSVSIPQRKGDPKVVSKDEGPRKESTAEKLATLRAVFRKGGSVTAGNSSTLNDGAAALVITSRAYAKANNLKIIAKVVNWASAGVDPTIMGIGPVPATEKLLAKSGLSADDFDAIELNEAFSKRNP